VGHPLFVLIAFIFVAGIWKNRNGRSLAWYFSGIVLFSNEVLIIKFPLAMQFSRILMYALIAFEMRGPERIQKNLPRFPLRWNLGFVFIGLCLIAAMDARLSVALKIYRPVITFLETYFLLLVIWNGLRDEAMSRQIWVALKWCSLLLCIYGIFNLISHTNPYCDFVSSLNGKASAFSKGVHDERFRVNSLHTISIYYGFLAGILFMQHQYGRSADVKNGIVGISTSLLLFSNVVLSNSRTALGVFVLMNAVVIVFRYNLMQKIRIGAVLVGLIFIVMNVTIFRDKVDNFIDVFLTGGGKVGGSSAQLRATQLASSLQVFEMSPIFGNGFGYISENLGWTNDDDTREFTDDFAGFESYAYTLLIEYGVVGMVGAGVMYLGLLTFFGLRLRAAPRYAPVGLALVIGDVVFMLSTGELGSFVVVMSMLGVFMKRVELESEERLLA